MFTKLAIFVTLLATFVVATPVSTVKSVSTGKPVSTVKPASTVKSVSTGKPVSTSKPVSTGEPVSTAIPASTTTAVSTAPPVHPSSTPGPHCSRGSLQCCEKLKHVTPGNATETDHTSLRDGLATIPRQAGVKCQPIKTLLDTLGSPSCEAQLVCCVSETIIEVLGARCLLLLVF
ncbi:hypothetical protein TRAPUB_119 [Trametes pubescens]|uniref:Hydrophobin n=1 Tax=Trametes pubescens TaxID=154538 RepID=A0A1M2VN03_TRAPU|nr:hypothetical protein TRAPUB_119 [Trametes pubescens]